MKDETTLAATAAEEQKEGVTVATATDINLKPGETIEKYSGEFEPKPIGNPDYRSFEKIVSTYDKLTKSANFLKKELEECLGKEYNAEQFIEFINSNPKGWISQEYIRNNNIQFPGMDTYKLIDLGVVNIDGLEKVLAALDDFKNKIANRDSFDSFFYPISKLWVEQSREFSVIENDFYDEVLNACTRFTDSEEQNKVLEILERIRDGFNDLTRLGLLRPKHGPGELEFLPAWFEIDNGFKSMDTTNIEEKQQPFTVCPVVFWRPRMSAYKVSGTYALKNIFKDPAKVCS